MFSGENVMNLFKDYQTKIDKVNDKYEKLVKISRDITVESKRLIFQLHRTDFSDKSKKRSDIDQKISKLNFQWKRVAKELNGEQYQFLKAYSPGLQEYIEAVTLEHYLKTGKLMSLKTLQKNLLFDDEIDQKDFGSKIMIEAVSHGSNEDTIEKAPKGDKTQLQVYIPLQEYLLGVADMTGEIMRVVIGRIGKYSFDEFSILCEFMRELCDNFEMLGNVDKYYSKKITVMRQSLKKVENALYTYKLRGTEVPSACFILPMINFNNNEFCENIDMEL